MEGPKIQRARLGANLNPWAADIVFSPLNSWKWRIYTLWILRGWTSLLPFTLVMMFENVQGCQFFLSLGTENWIHIRLRGDQALWGFDLCSAQSTSANITPECFWAMRAGAQCRCLMSDWWSNSLSQVACMTSSFPTFITWPALSHVYYTMNSFPMFITWSAFSHVCYMTSSSPCLLHDQLFPQVYYMTSSFPMFITRQALSPCLSHDKLFPHVYYMTSSFPCLLHDELLPHVYSRGLEAQFPKLTFPHYFTLFICPISFVASLQPTESFLDCDFSIYLICHPLRIQWLQRVDKELSLPSFKYSQNLL